MLIRALRAAYQADLEAHPDRYRPRGNPTGSRWGRCLAQSQMLLWPQVSHPEPYPLRTKLVFEAGDMFEAWWKAKVLEHFGNLVGMEQAVVYLPIRLPDDRTREYLRSRFQAKTLWGTVQPGFVPPYIREERGRIKMRVPGSYGRPKGDKLRALGFVLDPDGPEIGYGTLYAPANIDWVIRHPEYGLLLAEAKSMADFPFRRAVLGRPDLDIRMQLAGMAEASGLDAVWCLVRKQTSHLAEVYFRRREEKHRIAITTLNGMEEVFFVEADTLLDAQGVALEPVAKGIRGDSVALGDARWGEAEVWHPFDPGVVAAIRERVLRVLLHDPTTGAIWDREYGPSFTCRKCQATGRRYCGTCGGTGLTKVKKNPCGPCAGAGTVACKKCEGRGFLLQVELSYPCSYCPVVRTCYPMAKLEIDSKPHWLVAKDDWDQAGLVYHPATPAAAPEDPDEEEVTEQTEEAATA